MNSTQKNCLILSAILGALMLLYCPIESVIGGVEGVHYVPLGYDPIWEIDPGQRINGSQLAIQYAALAFVTATLYLAFRDSKR